jgi:hypothetical protein
MVPTGVVRTSVVRPSYSEQYNYFEETVHVLYMFFWVFPRRQYVVCRRFGTMYQYHLQRLEVDCLLPAFEDGTDTWFRNVGKLHIDAGKIPKRTYTISKSRRKLEI